MTRISLRAVRWVNQLEISKSLSPSTPSRPSSLHSIPPTGPPPPPLLILRPKVRPIAHSFHRHQSGIDLIYRSCSPSSPPSLALSRRTFSSKSSVAHSPPSPAVDSASYSVDAHSTNLSDPSHSPYLLRHHQPSVNLTFARFHGSSPRTFVAYSPDWFMAIA